MLYDLQRGRLPYYVLPPGMTSEAAETVGDIGDAPLDGALAFPEGNALQVTEGEAGAQGDAVEESTEASERVDVEKNASRVALVGCSREHATESDSRVTKKARTRPPNGS